MPVTVVVTSTTTTGVNASGVRGRVFNAARFEGNTFVIVGNGNKTDVDSVYKVRSVRFDYRELLNAMSGRARDALQALRHNPDDVDANRAFRNALRPPASSENVPQQETTAIAPGSPLLVNCSVIAIGHGRNHSTTNRHKIASLTIDLASLLADDKDLVSALAHHLADPGSASLRRNFFHGVKAAIDDADDLPGDISRAGRRVTVHGIGNRLDTAGPAVTTVGEHNITRVTRRFSYGDVIEDSFGRLGESIPPSCDPRPPSLSSSDPEPFGLPSSVQQARERNEPELGGPSIGGPGLFG